MLLPIYYYFKRGFVDEALCHYLVAEGRLSRSDDTFEKKLAYRNSIEALSIETLKSIRMPDKELQKYLKFVMVKNTRRRLILAADFHKKEFAKEQIKKLIKLKKVSFNDIKLYMKA